MKQLHYAALLTGLLLVGLVRANEEAELTPTKNHNIPAAASLLSSGGSRHRLLMHKKSHRRHLLMDSSPNGLLGGSDDVELDIDDEIDDLGVDNEEAVDDDEEEVDDERLLQKRKKTNNNKKKRKNGNNNNKKNNINKKKKNGNNNRKRNGSGNNKNRKPSINNKKMLIKQKLRNQEKIEEKQKDKRQDMCLCEDLYGPDYWSTPSWNDYDDDWDSTSKRKQYKNVRNKKRINGRLLLAEAEDKDEQEELHASFSGDDDEDQRRHLKADELIEHGDANEEEGDGTKSLAEDFAAAEKDEEEGGGGTMTLRFKKRQNRYNNNKKLNRRNNGGRDKWRSSNSGKEDSWSWGDDEWGDDEWGDDEWSDDEWGDDEWGDDSWGSDTWGSDTWRKPKEKWCPCPYVPPEPTYAPTLSPSLSPTESPTLYPTQDPTLSPSMEPTRNPTPRPTRQPTPFPTRRPTPRPTPRPTSQPTSSPTVTPGSLTKAPTSSPSQIPSSQPSLQPSTSKPAPGPKAPSSSPSQIPSSQPSLQPSTSKQPSSGPSANPSQVPSSQPSLQPSSQPSSSPSASQMPSSQPSLQPSSQPSSSPSASQMPSSQPSLQPSTSSQPSSGPSANPSQIPSSQPSNKPSPALTASITAVNSLTPDGLNFDEFTFGTSVAISGTSALIGAPFAIDDEKITGAAYLFESLTDTAKKLPLPDIPTGSECGDSVALSNEYAVIGCPGFKESLEGNKIGAVLIYTRGSTVDVDPRRITYRGINAAEGFGTSLSLNDRGFLAIGTKTGSVELVNLSNTIPDLLLTSTPGNGFDITNVALNDNIPPLLAVGAIKKAGDRSGSVFLYTDITNPNAVPEEISPPTAAKCASDCLFGFSVALLGNTLVVGSPETQNISNEASAGRAFVYNDVFKDQVQPLPPSTESQPPINALFGSSVAIADGAVVVGSPKYSIGSNGAIEIRGAAFLYNKNIEGFWYLPDFDSSSEEIENPILGGESDIIERFGDAVAISDEAFVVGVPLHSGSKGKAVAYSYTSAKNP